ncbi:MAG: CBS domain-containing protein [Polyangiales bacterium]
MSADPVTVTPATPVAEAVGLLMDVDFRHLPVVEGDTLVGILSDRDLRGLSAPRLVDAQALEELRARYESPVSSLMTPDVVTIDPESEAAEAAALMLEHRLSAVPVVESQSGNLVGMLSYLDLLRAYAHQSG